QSWGESANRESDQVRGQFVGGQRIAGVAIRHEDSARQVAAGRQLSAIGKHTVPAHRVELAGVGHEIELGEDLREILVRGPAPADLAGTGVEDVELVDLRISELQG